MGVYLCVYAQCARAFGWLYITWLLRWTLSLFLPILWQISRLRYPLFCAVNLCQFWPGYNPVEGPTVTSVKPSLMVTWSSAKSWSNFLNSSAIEFITTCRLVRCCDNHGIYIHVHNNQYNKERVMSYTSNTAYTGFDCRPSRKNESTPGSLNLDNINQLFDSTLNEVWPNLIYRY